MDSWGRGPAGRAIGLVRRCLHHAQVALGRAFRGRKARRAPWHRWRSGMATREQASLGPASKGNLGVPHRFGVPHR